MHPSQFARALRIHGFRVHDGPLGGLGYFKHDEFPSAGFGPVLDGKTFRILRRSTLHALLRQLGEARRDRDEREAKRAKKAQEAPDDR